MRPTLLLCITLFGFVGCTMGRFPDRDPVGTSFPSVEGESLDGKEFRVPEAFAGRPVLLLVGYSQRSQFDLDRWILGLMQARTPVKFAEIPTIHGILPGLFASQIDSGMRRGIPEEDWGGVITVYADAREIVEWTGNENPSNGRICLLDEEGTLVWFYDRGYSGGRLIELDAFIREMSAAGEEPDSEDATDPSNSE